MKPLVSIITVVYNDVSHILQTMESVLSQSYNSIEYIVIDGGSTDGTVDIIRSREDKLSYFVSERDKGIYDAMNKGVAHAKGEWTIFMNCGDFFYDSNVLTNIFDGYKDFGEGYIYGDTLLLGPNGDGVVVKATDRGGERLYMAGFHQSILTRTAELKKHPFSLDYKLISDLAFYYDLYERNPKRYYYQNVISKYDLTGISTRYIKKRAYEYFKFYLRKYDSRFIFWGLVYLKKAMFCQE